MVAYMVTDRDAQGIGVVMEKFNGTATNRYGMLRTGLRMKKSPQRLVL